MSPNEPMPIPRRWSSHSQATGDWRMDPEGQWVIWADVAEVIEWATARAVVVHDYLADKDRSADEQAGLVKDPSHCPSCGEWRVGRERGIRRG